MANYRLRRHLPLNGSGRQPFLLASRAQPCTHAIYLVDAAFYMAIAVFYIKEPPGRPGHGLAISVLD